MTLKEHLEYKEIPITNDDRMILGKRVSWIWAGQKMGDREYVQEDGFTVIDYTVKFLRSQPIERCINTFLKNGRG